MCKASALPAGLLLQPQGFNLIADQEAQGDVCAPEGATSSAVKTVENRQSFPPPCPRTLSCSRASPPALFWACASPARSLQMSEGSRRKGLCSHESSTCRASEQARGLCKRGLSQAAGPLAGLPIKVLLWAGAAGSGAEWGLGRAGREGLPRRDQHRPATVPATQACLCAGT